MNTQTLKLIWDLKELYHTLFNNWIETKEWCFEFDENFSYKIIMKIMKLYLIL